MSLIPNIIFYTFIFLSIYAQVFFLVTFLENRKKLITRNGKLKLDRYKKVTITVPCWNEEKTVYKTVRSLLELNYPPDKLSILLVDDGSTDGTLNVMRKFRKYNNIKIFHKKNEGKYKALNFGLENTETDFFGCLDADSFVDREALVRIMSYFEKDESIMAVAPSVIVHDPKNFVQNAQAAEYYMGVYFKKMLGFLGAINVTPGPFTIFRKRVFDELGYYRHGHNTEDMEIAYRMQKNRYKIEHCNDAYVYTNTPNTARKLYKQRLRWIYGFINNTIDYKNLIFRRKYGNFSLFTLPTGIITIFSVGYIFGRIVFSLFAYIHNKIILYKTIGFNFDFSTWDFDFFFINTESVVFLAVLIYCMVFLSMLFGRKMAKGTWGFPLKMFYFFPIFSFLAPFWLLKAVYNTVVSKKPSWR